MIFYFNLHKNIKTKMCELLLKKKNMCDRSHRKINKANNF